MNVREDLHSMVTRGRTEVRRLRRPSRGVLGSGPALSGHPTSRFESIAAMTPWAVARQRRLDTFTTKRLVVRPSKPGDADALVGIVDSLVLKQHGWGPADVEDLRQRVLTSRDYNQSIICLRRTGDVAGAIGVRTEGFPPDECDIGLWLGAGYRWGGYAVEVVKDTIDHLHDVGFDVVHAATREDNRAALRIYQRVGFEVTGTEEQRTPNGELATFVLARHVRPRQYRLHPDPEAPGEPALSRPYLRRGSPAFRAYREALQLGDRPVRDSVLDDLSTYYRFSVDEALDRCINWEAWSHEEWEKQQRDSVADIREFYRTVQSWSFDLLWYAYLQAEGVVPAVSVDLADALPKDLGRRHLDFGSGVGVTAQMMANLGYATEMADLSTALLEFARFRLERRGTDLPDIDLSKDDLPTDRYDFITAIDTLAHIPDLADTLASLHRALREGGVLYANIDFRDPSPENHSFLYSDDLPVKRLITRSGFRRQRALGIGEIICYRKVPTSGWQHRVALLRDDVLLGPLRVWSRRLRNAFRFR